MKKLVIAGLMSVVATAAFTQSTSNTTKNNSVGTPPEKPAAASGYASPTPTPSQGTGSSGSMGAGGSSSGSMGSGSGSSGSMGAGGSSSASKKRSSG